MFCCKTFKSKDHFVVAICDQNLLGKRIGKSIEFEVKKEFYGDELIDSEKAIELMKKSTIGNLIGKLIVKLAVEKKFIMKENVMFIGDIPHAQFIR